MLQGPAATRMQPLGRLPRVIRLPGKSHGHRVTLVQCEGRHSAAAVNGYGSLDRAGIRGGLGSHWIQPSWVG